MTGKERVLKTIYFENPDKIPVDLWILPAARIEYGEKLQQVLDENPRDIISVNGPGEISYDPQIYERGEFIDFWGCCWTNVNPGVIGEIKESLLGDDTVLKKYISAEDSPITRMKEMWDSGGALVSQKVAEARKTEKFLIGGWVNPFERMQFLRGVENLYCDIGLESEELYALRDFIWKFYRAYLQNWIAQDVDAIVFGDDWGSQRGLLIHPDKWRKLFKPMLAELMKIVQQAGKFVFVHSDGYIMDLYPEFIALGVKAINSQLWCMGVEQVSDLFAGKITFWGELSRQDVLPFGKPEDVERAAMLMKEKLFVNGGGLIGEFEISKDVPLINISTGLAAWNR